MTTKLKSKIKDTNQRPVFKSIDEAVAEIKNFATEKKRKFTESVDIALMLGIDPKQSTQNVKGFAVLPNGTGRKVKVIVITPDESSQKNALEAGAFKAGFEDLISEIDSGFMDFDSCIATPDAMQKLSKVAKKLGPKGLMPSPKNGTVTSDVVKSVNDSLKGKVSFKNEKNGIVHCMVGKVDFDSEKLSENIKTIIKAIKDIKPEGSKGKYIRKCYLSTTMGRSVEIFDGSI